MKYDYKLDRIFRCDDCNVSFSKKTNLTRHKREKHGKKSNFVCKPCKRSFARNEHLQNHLQNHEIKQKRAKEIRKKNNHKCLHCGKRYTRKEKLLTHMKKHD